MQQPEPFDAGSETAVKNRRSHVRLVDEQARADLQALLGETSGRRFLWGLLGRCDIYHQSFTGDVNWGLFNEGKRSVGLRLLKEITDASPVDYALMVKENQGENYG